MKNILDKKAVSELKQLPVKKYKQAVKKIGLILEFEKFSGAYVHNGGNRCDALDMFAAKKQVSVRSLERWIAKYRCQGAAGLVDARGGGKFNNEQITPEAFELFKSLYLTQQRLSLKLCWQNLNYIGRMEKKGWQIPNLKAMYAFVEKNIPKPVLVLHREGMAAYEAQCAPYIQVEADSIKPGQIWVGDHHQFNCFLRHRNKWIRPWITCWEDMRSRTICGWYISTSPNQTTILQAMKRAIEKFGPPDSVKIDNGRDYDSQMFTGTTKRKRKQGCLDEEMITGIYAMMNITISFAIPYHPQSKPIERFFDTLDCQFTKTFNTYCGKDSHRKPEDLNKLLSNEKVINQAHDIESFSRLVSGYIEAYNDTPHSGQGMDSRTPIEVMSTRQSRRVLAEGILELLMRVWSGELTVGKNGVYFRGLYYGQYDTTLMMHQGKKVRIAYNPDDLSSVDVYDATTFKLITIVEQNQFVPYGSAVNEEHLRKAMAEKSKAVKAAKQYHNSRLAANMDLPTLTIKAMKEAARRPHQPEMIQTLRPVSTVMDNQGELHRKMKNQKALRKAVGSDLQVDIDLSILQGQQSKGEKLDFFGRQGNDR